MPDNAPELMIKPLMVLLDVGPVIMPVTSSVPATVVLPEASVTVNLLVLMAKVVPLSVILELPRVVAAVNFGIVLAVPEPPIPPLPAVQSHVAVAATQARVSVSAQPLSSDTPEEDTSSPELVEVLDDVPDVGRSTERVTEPLLPPPVNPSPAVTPSMSPDELELEEDVEEMVIVVPDVETDVPPEPAIVKAPVALLTEVTRPAVSKETTGFCPPVTLTPVPPVTE